MKLTRIKDIINTILRYMMRNHYCCGCYCDEYFICCYIVKDDYYRLTKHFNLDWIMEDTKWTDILAAINFFINDVNNSFIAYEKQHFTEGDK